jgi:hypothetical protein
MTDVEKFYYALQSKIGGTKKWHELDPMQQMQFVQAINIIIQVMALK